MTEDREEEEGVDGGQAARLLMMPTGLWKGSWGNHRGSWITFRPQDLSQKARKHSQALPPSTTEVWVLFNIEPGGRCAVSSQ